MKIVIWGAGRRGKSAASQIGKKWIGAFLEKNPDKVGTDLMGIPVIDFEEYEKKYSVCPILISFADEEKGIEELRERNIQLFFLLSDCPGEYQEPNQRNLLFQYIRSRLKQNSKYDLFGCNLFSLQLYEILEKEFSCDVLLLYEDSVSAELIIYLENHGYRLQQYNYQNDENTEKIICRHISGDSRQRFLDDGWKYYYDCSTQIADYYNPEIEKFKDKHLDESVVIVATGPSLLASDLDLINERGICTIAVGEIWHIFNETKWRPTYFVKQDGPTQQLFSKELEGVESEQTFIGDTYEPFWKERRKSLRYHVGYELAEDRRPDFSEDFSRVAYFAHTVTYAALQLAFYMGFSTVYLLGVDFSVGKVKKNEGYGHFYKGTVFNAVGYYKPVMQGFLSAKEYSEAHGKKIYNATRGGYLEVFERVDFGSIFGGSESEANKRNRR